MKKNLLAKTILFATVALMAAFGARADVAEGDIYSIDLVDKYNGKIPSEDNPLRISDTAVIRVRMLNRGFGTEAATPWEFSPKVGMSDALLKNYYPPKLGLKFGGKDVYATFIESKEVKSPADCYTDLFFSYTVTSGDLAMPAQLMNSNGEPASATISFDYKLLNDMYWALVDGNNNQAVFHFRSEGALPESPDVPGEPQNYCVSGIGMGLYVKTVDLDKNYAEPGKTAADVDIWRKIYRNMTTTTQYGLPSIAVEGGGVSDEATTMYVWVKDEDIACPLKTDGTELVDGRTVLPVTVPKGASSVPFKLQGVSNGQTEVYMSSSKKLVYDDMGQLVENWVTRTIQVIDPPDPFVSLDLFTPSGEPVSTVNCTADYEHYVAMMTVTLSQVPSADLQVTIVPELEDGDIFDDGLLGISLTPDSSPWLNDDLEFTFKPSDGLQKTLYIYAKGTTKKLSAKGVKFTAFTEGAPEFDEESGNHFCNLIVTQDTPKLVRPEAGFHITGAMAGKGYSLDIAILDSYKYMVDAVGGDSYYTVYYKVAAEGMDSAEWESDDAVALEDTESGAATINIPFEVEGENTITLYVLSPSGKKSAQTVITATVAAAKKAWATLDREDNTYAEGETAHVTFHLSQAVPGSKTYYGFLVPRDDDAKNKLSSAVFSTATPNLGSAIAPGDSDSDGISADVTILDGNVTATYDVFICTEPTYSKTKSAGYSVGQLTIKGTNVNPSVKSVSFGGVDVTVDGVVLSDNPVVRDIKKKFRVSVGDTEPSELDLNGEKVGEVDNRFRTQWKFGSDEWQDMYGNPEAETSFVEHAFNSSGNHVVKVRVQDKDMRLANKWSEEFTFTVVVLDSPSVIITSLSGTTIFNESQRGRANSLFAVTLSAPPVFANATDRLVVNLASALPDNCELSKSTIEFRSGDVGNLTDSAYQFYFSDLDGTQESAKDFKITATVTEESQNLDTEGKKWAQGEADITVLNEAPVILRPAEPAVDEEGNPKVEWEMPLGTEVSIPWAVRDVDKDMSKLTVTWRTSEGQTKVYSGAEAESGTHKFTFQSSGEGKSVTITVEDKDKDSTSVTLYYNVTPAKQLEVIPHGPESGAGTPLSHRYSNALRHVVAGVECGGLGSGYVWVDEMTQGEKGKTQVYNCGNATSKRVKAVGFKAGETGYSDTVLDSFAYAFLQIIHSEGGKSRPTDVMLALTPYEHLGETAVAMPDLPTEPNKDGSYLETTVEAIFSKEYRPLDNCGDINGDGIPDWAIAKYGLGVYDVDSLEMVANDLNDVSAYNEDEDLLPKGSSGGNSLVPNAPSGWNQNLPFHALLEIRGLGLGLNGRYKNADGSIPARDFTIYEEMAFRTYYNETEAKDDESLRVPVATEDKKALAGLDEDQTARLDAFWQTTTWTPENPTDPTKADTDGDGMEDGYEYWFWYGATVGYPNGEGAWQGLMTGRRLDEGNIDSFEPILPVDIANAFNPTVSGVTEGNAATMGTLATRDFDGDGLTDFEEYVIGTNPVDFDTDGDGMMDGWEVLRGLNPCSNKEIDPNQGPLNPDGDVMAYTDLKTELYPGLDRDKQPTITITLEREVMNQVFNPSTFQIEEVPSTVVYFYVVLDEDFVTLRETYEEAMNLLEYYREILPDIRDPEIRAEIEQQIAELEKTPPPDSFKGLELCHFDKADKPDYDLDYILSTYFHSIGGELVAKNPGTYGVQKLSEEDLENMVYEEDVQAETHHAFALLHNQLYNVFGFNPQTGWGGGIYERPYNTLYEYQLFKYRQLVLGGLLSANPNTILNRFSINTTNPSLPYEITYGDKESASTSDNHGADSDADGMPDGWELYVGLNPSNAQDASLPPDLDGDKLSQPQEFAGTTSTLAYEGCESIMAHFDSVWPNKFYPTDPHNSDTDGDGISDGEEGGYWEDYFYDGRQSYHDLQRFTFNYDSSIDRRKGFARFEVCYRGGGLDPNSIDTDQDGLPDLWERQFAGFVVNGSGVPVYGPAVYTDKLKAADGTLNGITPIIDTPDPDRNSRNGNGHFIAGGMDGTYSYDAYTDMDVAERMDYRTGTYRDYDFDGDGLQNYQEYMTQAVRSFRYDDSETPLNGRIVKWSEDKLNAEIIAEKENANGAIISERVATDGYNYPAFDYTSATNFYAIAIEDEANAGMKALYESADNDYDPKNWDWASTGYFAPPPHEWDPAASLIPDGIYMLPPSSLLEGSGTLPMRTISLGYVSTDPRQWDSDNDGTDDYWELYHGLNPLYGGETGRDIISEIALGLTAKENAWTQFGDLEANYDFDRYPWLAGAPDADPDNDKIRNFEEAITGNMTSPTTSHTDPTPLWMTEPSAPLSVTRQSYVYYDTKLPWMRASEGVDSGRYYTYTFEGNEGYDTDNDWTADSRELTAGIIAATDPLVASDPYRRAAIYLGGAADNGVAYQRTGSYINTFSEKLNSDAAYDMFRQFTVECWVKPEAEGTILERGAVYTPATAGAEQNAEQWRANFRLEFKNGKFVGSFDDSAAVPSGTPGSGCTVVSRESVKLGEWTHLALAYDGKELILYVNGEQQAYALCSLIPANGIIPILQDPTWSEDYPNASFAVAPGALVIGARHIKYPLTFNPANAGAATYPTTIGAALQEFFKGYVAEVRIWDGARSETQIAAEFNKAYTLEDVEANRAEVFAAWSNDAKRNDNANAMGTSAIPPQLMMHYDFTSLPGAINKADVALVPGGFDPLATFANATAVDKTLLTPSWWINQSSVYTDATVIPWIENTVAHLPAMDGSFADSIYWADSRASYVSSNEAGYDSFKIPNSANPYGWVTDELENDNRRFKLIRYEEMHPEYEGLYLKWKFASRSRMVGATDLLPLGGAFAKRESDYWDGQGAMTAWMLTKVDTDGDGVPDWYVGNPADYMRALIAGLLPDGTTNPAFRDRADFNGNGLPDWWEQIYGISGQNGHTDSDKDGLSNYVEYLLNEVYTIPGKSFDPINPKTNGYVPDAYVKLGKLYIADVFTDHDHMADTWEVKFGDLAKVSPYVYDANKDADGDGWTNYAEFQADTDPTRNASLAIDGIEVAQYPVPIVEASITYLGEQNVNCPIVVQAWNCADEKSRTFQSIPDAKWTIGETNAEDDNKTTSNTNGMAKTKFVGMNPAREVMTHLSPGSVVAGSFKLECKDPGWFAVDILTGQGYTYGADSATWEESAHDKMRNDGSGKGDIILGQNDEVVGEIDYSTGAVTLDFTALPEYMTFAYNLANPTDASRWSIYTYANSYMRFSWLSKPVSAGRTSIYYLGDADPRGENNNSVGHVKEGKNNFIVFADTIQANGKYDPGEPFGVAYGVDVGWNYGKLAIELTDTNPVFARYQLTTDTADRQVIWPNSPDMTSVAGSINASAAEEATTRIRVFMTARAVASTPTVLKPTAIATLSVMDKVIDLSAAGRNYIHEGDILDPENGIYDIAWNCMPNPESEDVVEAVFTILRGNTQIGSTQSLAQVLDGSNVFVQAQSVIRRYDAKDNRKKAVQIAPAPQLESVVNSPRPTFKWADASVGTYVYNTYTAFQIKVTGVDNSFSWTSGLQLMPPKSADGYYSWTAPICANCVTKDGKLFENGKRYKWQISTYNAKFKADYYGGEATFYLNVPEDQLDYGAIDVAVKYFGHPDVLNGGIVRVEAFDTPDFSGLSASEGYVKTTDLGSVSDSMAAPIKNASIIGLTEGSYYVMAYIDTNNNGKRDGWESWGYACVRDQRDGIIYTPKSIKVGPKVGTRKLVTVYIDDCDTDQDGLPDAWEWKKSGNLTAKGAAELDQRTAGSYVSVKDPTKDLAGTLDDQSKPNPVASGLATLMSTSLGNANLLAAMMGLDVKEGENPNDAIINASNDAKIAEHSLSIANFEVVDGKAKFKVVADVESGAADSELSVFYTFPVVENLEVEYQIWKYSSLAANPAVVKTGLIKLGKTEAEIEIPIDSADATGAMYQIKVFQE